MALIQTPGIGRKLQQRYRLQELPDGVLAPEVVPVVLVDDLSAFLEETERPCLGTAFVSATVGQFSQVAYISRGTKGTYKSVLRGVLVSVGAATDIIIRRASPTIAWTIFVTESFTRTFQEFGVAGLPQDFIGAAANAALEAGTDFVRVQMPANTPRYIPLNLSLAGPRFTNRAIMVAAATVNIGCRCTFYWTEGTPNG